MVSAEPIAKSTGKPVLTMSGRIASTNVGQKLTLDAAQIAAIPTSTLSVYEPFEKRQITFTGVPLADLFAKAGVDPGATTVVMQALDDYQSSFPVAEVAAEGFLATAEAGKPIPIKAGGPIRVVFRASSTLGKLEHSWIWSVNRMTFS